MRSPDRLDGAGFLGWLADTPLAEVFQRIAHEGKSGDLQVTLPKAIKTVYFDRGFVVFASSNLKNDRLGESMIEAGRISRHEFALATMVMKSTKRKFGETLVEAGILSEEELGQHVARQVNRIVLSLYSAKEGMYSFDERPCTIPVRLMVSLSVYRILLEGTRRMSSKRLVLAGLPPPNTKLRIAAEPPFTLDVDKLRPVEKDVLRAARDGARLSKIVIDVGGNDGVTLRAIYGLCCAGVLEVAAPESEGRILRVQEETGSFVLSEIRNKVEERREAVVEPEVVDEEEDVPVPVPVPAPEPAVFEVEEPVPVSEPEPAARVEPAPRPAPKGPAPPSEAWDRVRSRLLAWWRVIWDPIEATLLRWVGSTGEPPEELERLPPPPREALKPPEARVPASAPVAEEEPAPAEEDEVGVPTWSIVSTEETEEEPAPTRLEAPSWSIRDDRRDEETDEPVDPASVGVPSWSVVDPAEELPEPEPNLFAEPGPMSALDNELFIETDAAEDEESSMLSQIPVEPIAVSEEAVEIEVVVEEDPFRDVGDTELRSSAAPLELEVEREPLKAVEPVEPAPPKPAPIVGAEDESSQEERAAAARDEAMRRMKHSGGEGRLFRDVKLHFKLQDWDGAVPLLEQLVAISPGKALYRGMLARAMSRVPHLRKDAEEHFIEALRLSPQDAELHYWLGLYYKTFGLNSRAVTEFRTTLRIDPRHEGARKQLGAGRKDDALGSVIKKIFG